MKKSRVNAPYLQVVHGNTAPDFTPPCPPGISQYDWLMLWHPEEINAGLYDYWLLHEGPFIPDATLKAQGLIPADWCMAHDEAFIHRDDDPLVPTTP